VRDLQGERAPTIADLSALESAIQLTDAALVIIDPLMAYIPDGRDSHRDQDIRRVLAPLAALAARTDAAVVVIRHLNKSGVGNPLYRGGGSIGIIGAARSGLLVATDPHDPDGPRRILVVTKSNLAAPPPALAYRVVASEGVPHLLWEGETRHTAEQLLAPKLPEEERSSIEEAEEFLAGLLANGPRPAREVKAAGRQEGIAERTLDRARLRLGVTTHREGFGRGACYTWALPTPPIFRASQPSRDGEYGTHGAHGSRPPSPPKENGPMEQPAPDAVEARSIVVSGGSTADREDALSQLETVAQGSFGGEVVYDGPPLPEK
jgi:hypothetical protein